MQLHHFNLAFFLLLFFPLQCAYHLNLTLYLPIIAAIFCKQKMYNTFEKTIKHLFAEACHLASCKFQTDKDSFWRLYNHLQPSLDSTFTKEKASPKANNTIHTSLRLAAALQFFAGGLYLDIFMDMGVGLTSLYDSIWAVVNAVNSYLVLKIKFPNKTEQKEITCRFKKRAEQSSIIALDVLMLSSYGQRSHQRHTVNKLTLERNIFL